MLEQKQESYLSYLHSLLKHLQSSPKPSKAKQNPTPTVQPVVKTVRYTSRFYFNLAHKIWALLIISFVAELAVLFAYGHSKSLAVTSHYPPLPLVLLLIPGLLSVMDPDWPLRLLFKATQLQSNLLPYREKFGVWGVVLIAIILLLELATKIGTKSLYALVVILLIFLRSIFSVRKSVQDRLKVLKAEQKSKILWVESVNYKIFACAVLPWICVRISNLGVLLLAVNSRTNNTDLLAWSLASLTILLALRPKPEHFFTKCKGCGAETSRALQNYDYCPRCAWDSFQEQEEAVEVKQNE